MMNLLIVDDEFFIAEGIAENLNDANIDLDEIYTAYSAEDARNVIQSKDVSILITDVEMPMETGMDLLRWVKEKELPIISILLTGHRKFEYAYEAIEYGCLGYLVKPVSKDKLYETTAGAVEAVQKERAFKKWWETLSDDEKSILLEDREQEDIIAKITSVIKDNICLQEMNRSFIAKKVFLNEDYLSYIFHKRTGDTLKHYILSERISRVRLYLKSTDLSIDEIAEKTGFSDPGHLRRVFKKSTGLTPQQYRQSQ